MCSSYFINIIITASVNEGKPPPVSGKNNMVDDSHDTAKWFTNWEALTLGLGDLTYLYIITSRMHSFQLFRCIQIWDLLLLATITPC